MPIRNPMHAVLRQATVAVYRFLPMFHFRAIGWR
jgi:hypothetical protein